LKINADVLEKLVMPRKLEKTTEFNYTFAL
jgi:hypothetical protein